MTEKPRMTASDPTEAIAFAALSPDERRAQLRGRARTIVVAVPEGDS